MDPLIPLNNFPSGGTSINTFKQKSAFNSGDAGGTGNQIYSYRLDLGVNDSFLYLDLFQKLMILFAQRSKNNNHYKA